jgi:NAD(P)-dependent dehydrogenase (short-subunit alcohol dehydrogenase family)
VAATLSSPGESAYDASKAALTAFSESMAVDLWDTGIKVLVVYPGLVDTELFSLPDNDPVATDLVPVPTSELVDAVFEALGTGAAQVYVPAWFGDLPLVKAKDLDGFLAGTAAYLAQQRAGG